MSVYVVYQAQYKIINYERYVRYHILRYFDDWRKANAMCARLTDVGMLTSCMDISTEPILFWSMIVAAEPSTAAETYAIARFAWTDMKMEKEKGGTRNEARQRRSALRLVRRREQGLHL